MRKNREIGGRKGWWGGKVEKDDGKDKGLPLFSTVRLFCQLVFCDTGSIEQPGKWILTWHDFEREFSYGKHHQWIVLSGV